MTQLAAGRTLEFASCRGVWGERFCPRSATAIHSVAVDRTPNLSIGRRTLYHWAIAAFGLLPKELRFEPGSAKCVSRPGRHLSLLRPWPGDHAVSLPAARQTMVLLARVVKLTCVSFRHRSRTQDAMTGFLFLQLVMTCVRFFCITHMWWWNGWRSWLGQAKRVSSVSIWAESQRRLKTVKTKKAGNGSFEKVLT